jgi:hypothetical protein
LPSLVDVLEKIPPPEIASASGDRTMPSATMTTMPGMIRSTKRNAAIPNKISCSGLPGLTDTWEPPELPELPEMSDERTIATSRKGRRVVVKCFSRVSVLFICTISVAACHLQIQTVISSDHNGCGSCSVF